MTLFILAESLLFNETAATRHRKVPLSKNLAVSRQWSCSVPQPRLIYIGNTSIMHSIKLKSCLRAINADSVEEYANRPNVFYQPPAVLVHRCDRSTGCCLTLGEECSSVEQEEDDVTFVVLEVEHSSDDHQATGDGENNQRRRHSGGAKKPAFIKNKIHVNLRNHTVCECATRANNRSR